MHHPPASRISMKSGLEDRNNAEGLAARVWLYWVVSMKSGLEDRNNAFEGPALRNRLLSLNEVRPGRPEQWTGILAWDNNQTRGLNEVRPGRPEQLRLT